MSLNSVESGGSPVRCLMVEPTGRGAHDRYAHALCKELIRLGVKVDLLTSSEQTPLPSPARLLEMSELTGFSIPMIGPVWRKLDRAVRLVVNHRRLKRVLKRGRHDIVHLQILNALFLPSLKRLCRRIGTRLVVTKHNMRSHYVNKRFWNGLNRFFFSRYHTLVDAFVAHSHYHRLGLTREGVNGDRIFTIPYGPHPEYPGKSTVGREVNTVLMAGGLRANKGVDTLIQALKILDRSPLPGKPPVKVRIVGRSMNDRLTRRISTVAEDLRHVSLEHLNRYVTGKEYNDCFARSQVLVLPYTRQFSSLSGVLLEGYLHDNELVVTDAGANGETVRADDTGIVVPPGNPEALAEGLKEALIKGHDPDRSARRSKLLETRFNWETAARDTAMMYRAILSGTDPP